MCKYYACVVNKYIAEVSNQLALMSYRNLCSVSGVVKGQNLTKIESIHKLRMLIYSIRAVSCTFPFDFSGSSHDIS